MANILAIDQGTTSSRAMVFDENAAMRAVAQAEFAQHYPADGHVEHNPEEIWATTVAVCREALAEVSSEPVAIGITNQRETTVVWDRATGEPIYNAIVWQDRRTAVDCEALRADGHEPSVTVKTGLLLDPYFSATKVAWILDHVEGARARAERGELAFGTIDTFLIWRLTGGRVHATDATNASRTMLFDICSQQWDAELLDLFRVPVSILPDVRDCADDFGTSTVESIGVAVPITGVAGDQQAALVGQACFAPGMVKSTYGTGCFAMMNTGREVARSQNRLLSTVAYRLNGQTTYGLEGSIFIAGAAVQWLRDGLQLVQTADETEALAKQAGEDGVYMVPAFTGLGAPYWDPHARGALTGLTRDTGIAQVVRATLDSVCLQTYDLVVAMSADRGAPISSVRVDGGMVANDWFLNRLADIVDVAVGRPQCIETTALGAAYLAGLQVGVFSGLDDIAARWQLDQNFAPSIDAELRERLLVGWTRAVASVRV
jgi:glycerol kinase